MDLTNATKVEFDDLASINEDLYMWQKFNLKQLRQQHARSSDRSFGIFLAVFAALYFYISDVQGLLWAISGVVLSLAIIFPKSLGNINKCWHDLGLFLGWLVSPLFLMIIYYLIFSPMAILTKICGHKTFKNSQWIKKQKPCRFDKSF